MNNDSVKDKRILFIINNLGVGGAERLVVDDINEMVRRRIDVRLLTLKNESKKSLSPQCLIFRGNWEVAHFKNFFDFSSWMQVVKYIIDIKPDVVISHLWFANTIGRISCFFTGYRNIISFEQNVYDTLKTRKMFLADYILQFFCKKVIAVSQTVKKSLIMHRIHANRIEVIYNSINIEKYKIRPNVNLKEQLGIAKDTFVFLSVGRLIYQKGVDVLLRSFAKLSSSALLLIVGQGEEEDTLKKLAIDLGITEKVNFIGVRQDVPDILSFCDCFVLPSRYEGFSLVLLEAMASAKPIIVSDFEAGKEIIVNGENGLVFRQAEEGELAIMMNRMVADYQLRERLKYSAAAKLADFSIKKHVDKLLSY